MKDWLIWIGAMCVPLTVGAFFAYLYSTGHGGACLVGVSVMTLIACNIGVLYPRHEKS